MKGSEQHPDGGETASVTQPQDPDGATASSPNDNFGLPRFTSSQRTSMVLDGLVNAIRAGRFPSGRLPPENELAEVMGVSRTTVRSALRSLEQIGMIDRRQGRGTRLRSNVTPEVLAIHGLVPFSALLGQEHKVTSQGSLVSHEHAPAEISIRLRDGEAAYEISRVLYSDDSPAISMREWIPREALARPLTNDDAAYHSILEIAAVAFTRPIDHAVAKLIPRAAAPGDRNSLQLTVGEPYLFLEETFYSAEEVPLALSFVSVNPHAVEFSIFRRHP